MECKSHRTTGFVGVASVILLALGLAGLNMLLSVQAVALDLDFYVAKWAELDIPASAKMSMEDLRLAGTKLLGYFTGSEADPQLMAVVDGTLRPVFREHEIQHLHDVRDLFQLGFAAKKVCYGLIVLGILLAAWQPGGDKTASPGLRTGWLVSKSLIIGGVPVLAATIILALPAARDFTRWWTAFHLVTFDNDLWRLDPATDWLIRIFPEEFFFAAVKRIGLYSLAATAACIVLGVILNFAVSQLSSHYSKYNL